MSSSVESDKKAEAINQVETSGTGDSNGKPTFGQRTKRHCARWWWLHLIIFIIVVLVVVLPIIYVAVPKIEQNGINDSTLNFTSIQYLDPTADTITLISESVQHSTSSYKPTLDSFNASLSLVVNGTVMASPILYVQIPSVKVQKGDNNVSVVAKDTPIASQDSLSAYSSACLTQEYVTIQLAGKTKIHEGGLPVNTVNYNKTVTYKGLNGLAGLNVTSPALNLSASGTEPNFSGQLFIPNPSFMTIEMGNVTFDMFTSNVTTGPVGTSTVEDMRIVPGDNYFPMTALINTTLVAGSLLPNGYVNMEVTPTAAVVNGTNITYYQEALASNPLVLSLNVAQVLTDALAGSS